jgi:hypothetical protein
MLVSKQESLIKTGSLSYSKAVTGVYHPVDSEKFNASLVSAQARIFFPKMYNGIVVTMTPKVNAVNVEKKTTGPCAA